jgi:hypothetical protein
VEVREVCRPSADDALFLFQELSNVFMSSCNGSSILSSCGLALLAGCLLLFPHQAIGGENDSSSTGRSDFYALPFAFYTPETKLAVGGGLVGLFRGSIDPSEKPSSITASVQAAMTGQYLFLFNPQIYSSGNTVLFAAEAKYGLVIDRFYGIGGLAPDIGNPSYARQLFDVRALIRKRLTEGLEAGPAIEVSHERITDARSNPYLQTGSALVREEGWLAGAGFVIVHDSRDDVFFPSSGSDLRLRAVSFGRSIGSQYAFLYAEADLRGYYSNEETQTVALQLYGKAVTGQPPFYRLAALGGQNLLRGYFEGRVRDKTCLAAQAEYRQAMFGRITGVVFVGVGAVAASSGQLALPGLLASIGTGLRFRIDRHEKINLRLDLGVGRNAVGIYFGVGEAF